MKSNKFFIIFFSMIFSASHGNASDIDVNAIQKLKDLSNFVCGKMSLEGKSENLQLDGEAKLELAKLVGGLVQAGVEGAAKYKSESYLNVLREDLSGQLDATRKCNQEIYNDMKGTIIKDTSEANSSKRYGAIVQVKIKDGNSRGAYSGYFSSDAPSQKVAIDEAMSDCKKHNSVGCAVSETISGDECAISYFRKTEMPKIVIGSTDEMTFKMYKDQCGGSEECIVLFSTCATRKG